MRKLYQQICTYTGEYAVETLPLQEIRQKAAGKKRVVFVSGNFNVIHPGHLRLLKFAAECGEYLVVGLNPDSRDAYVPAALRLDGLKSISFVNHAFIMSGSVDGVIRELKPNIIVKGKEHEKQNNREKSVLDEYGGQILFGSGEVVFSSIDLLKKEAVELNSASITHATNYLERHNIEMTSMQSVIKRFSDLKMVVLGDVIVDDYIACDPLGMSQEDPTIVVTPVLTERYLGGAGIVAAHAAGLGAEVRFVSVVGEDETAHFARQKLSSYGVDFNLLADSSRPTTLKQRFRASGKTLLRVSHLKQHSISEDHENRFVESVLDYLGDAQLLVFSDFNYGVLSDRVIQKISNHCKQKNIVTVADCQASSQIGDISRYKDCFLITPTEREARLAMQDNKSGLASLAENLRQKARAQTLVITMGAEGLFISAGTDASSTDQLPALNRNPKDVSGAGDSFLTCSSMAAVAGANVWESCYLGSLAAACQVSRLGNVPLCAKDLELELATH